MLVTHIGRVVMLQGGAEAPALRKRGYFQAECTCWWLGPPRTTMRAAYADLDQHEIDHPIHSHVNTSKLSEGAAQ